MKLSAICEALAAAGATTEMILAAIRAAELEQEQTVAERRAKDAERQRRCRASRTVTVTPRDSRDTVRQDVTPSTPLDAPFTLSPDPLPESPLNPPAIPFPLTPEPLPGWMPVKDWEDFKAMRRKIKAPMTPAAERLAVGKLDDLRRKGHDPGRVLQQSIMNSYKGLFEIKEERNGSGSKHQHFDQQDYRADTGGFDVV